jgi:ankyrin repeat protein
MIDLLVDGGAAIDASTDRQAPALHIAIQRGHLDAARRLIVRGGSPDVSHGGWTALQRAAYSGNAAVVEALIDAGADINLQNGPWTALALATRGGHASVRDLLLQRGAR